MSPRDLDEHVDTVIDRRIDKRRLKFKDKDMIETVEEVFDSFTLESLYRVMRHTGIRRLYGVVSAGKEARVYRAVDSRGNEYAVKIYLTFTSEFKKGIWKYIMGDPRFENARITSTKSLMYLWARKEFKNLKKMYSAGVRVPRPVYGYNNIVVMEFIGKDGRRAPLLKEITVRGREALSLLEKILNNVILIYCKAKLVHADLSEFNIMVPHADEVVIIDVAQAVSIEHPNSDMFLYKDVENMHRYFTREANLNLKPPEFILEVIKQCPTRFSVEDILATSSS